ncbi:MAG: hypothetical protein E6Q97_32910 [Desulfurellales bacterium]|nr:MAG: hypothetical protein E6Q97_32910 [Desulfurellales bacterium]
MKPELNECEQCEALRKEIKNLNRKLERTLSALKALVAVRSQETLAFAGIVLIENSPGSEDLLARLAKAIGGTHHENQ